MLSLTHTNGDSLLARRLWLAGRDQEALFHDDSALVLYRAARRADPEYLPPHIAYFHLMWRRWALAELRREYAATPDTGPVERCMTVVTTYAATVGAVDAERVALRDVAADATCSAYFLAFRSWESSPAAALSDARRAALELPEVVGAWHNHADALSRAGRRDEARRVLEQGLERVPHVLDRLELEMALGWGLTKVGDTARAVAVWRAAQAAAVRDGRAGVLAGYLGLAPDLRVTVGISWQARDLELLRIGRASGSWSGEWGALQNLGHDFVDAGEPAKAILYDDRLVAIADSVGLPGLRLVGYTMRGRAYAKVGRLQDAERDLRDAVRAGADAAPPYFLAEAYHNLAHVYESAGRYAEASQAADRFVAVAQRQRRNSQWVMSLHDAGVIREKAGWHAAANDAFARMVREVDALNTEHYWAGEYLERSGDLRGALAYYRAGVALGLPDDNLRGEVRVFEALGNLDSAERVARIHDSRILRWTPLEVPLVPEILARRGHVDAAVSEARAWATRQAAGGNVQGAALAHLQVASLLLNGQRAEAAIPEAVVAESLAMSLNFTDELVTARRLKGLALTRAGDPAAGLEALMSAAALALAHPTSDPVFTTQVALGDALASARPRDALAAYDRAAREAERLGERLGDDLDRIGYRDRHLAPFDGAVRVSLSMVASGAPLDGLLRWSVRRKGAALALGMQMPVVNPAAGVDRLSVGWVQRRLAVREALLDYLVVDSTVAVLVVTPRRAALVRLPIGADSLTRMVARLRRPLVAAYAGRVDLSRARYDVGLAAALHHVLLAPLRIALGDADQLLIALDGPLHDLSFDALVAPSAHGRPADYSDAHYVIDDFTIEYLPSVQLLTRTVAPAGRAPRIDGRVLVVERDVPGGQGEVEAIRATWGEARVTAITGAHATETAVRAALVSFPIINLALHATADSRDPIAAYFSLAADSLGDGFLHMNEIASQRMRARLVVLSACETQSGRIYGGEGVISLARAFLMGGAEAVVATEWPVGGSAAPLMGGFYKALATGSPPAVALRAAKLTLRRDPATAHPFYWAGFILIRGVSSH